MEHAHRIRICTPAIEVTALRAEERGSNTQDFVFNGQLEQMPGHREIESSAVIEFANCRVDRDGITRFTRRYGPLWQYDKSGSFAFLMAVWAADRKQFRRAWDSFLGLEVHPDNMPLGAVGELAELFRKHQAPWNKVPVAGVFELSLSRLVYVPDTLYAGLLIKLLALGETNKLRRCAHPHCEMNRYFLAQHGRQQYCSDICTAWGQARAKKGWWIMHGDEWRKEHPQKTGKKAIRRKKETKDGTQKAR